jgi:hypothetical protein
MAFDALTGWATGQVVHSGDEAANGVEGEDTGVYSTKDAQHLAVLLQQIIDALDYIADN